MKSHRTLWIGCLICLLFLGIAGRAYVVQTVQTYGGSCEKLHGLPGVLQQAGFMPRGNCEMDKDHDSCKEGSCEVNGRKGHCEEKKLGHHQVTCVCMPNRPSR